MKRCHPGFLGRLTRRPTPATPSSCGPIPDLLGRTRCRRAGVLAWPPAAGVTHAEIAGSFAFRRSGQPGGGWRSHRLPPAKVTLAASTTGCSKTAISACRSAQAAQGFLCLGRVPQRRQTRVAEPAANHCTCSCDPELGIIPQGPKSPPLHELRFSGRLGEEGAIKFFAADPKPNSSKSDGHPQLIRAGSQLLEISSWMRPVD